MTRWLHQTTFSDKEKGTVGNCTQAAIASYLGLTQDQVPDWNNEMREQTAWEFWDAIHDWFATQGYYFHYANKNQTFPGLYLVSGVSPRNPDLRHMVVYENGKLKHDPHPDGGGIVGDPEMVYVAVPLDPKILTPTPDIIHSDG